MKKIAFLSFNPYGLVSKKRIFLVEKSIFFKNRESGLKTFWEGKQDPQAAPNTLVIISWKFKEVWKNRFLGYFFE